MTPDDLALAAVDIAVRNQDGATLDRLAELLDAEDEAVRRESLGCAAGRYASAGLAVFPLVPGEKRPLTKRGLHDASTDPEQIAAWWARWEQANIGLRTGLLFDVIDVDGPPGYLSLADLGDSGALPEVLGRVHTARGGVHLYVPRTGRGNKAGVYPGIDYRGVGGYVVAPPSLSATTGRRWTWTTPVDFAALTHAGGTAA